MRTTLAFRRGLSAAILCFGLVLFAQSLDWIERAFPGFFVMPNRVVPSAGLPDWAGVSNGQPLYQQVLVAVGDTPATRGRDAYDAAARLGAGADATYTFSSGGRLETRTIAVRTFTRRDHALVFGAYFLSGLAYLLLAAMASEHWNRAPAFQGFALFGWIAAIFAFTAIDLYGDGRFFRLHALAEAGLIAGAAHLALVCPRDLLAQRPHVRSVLYGGAFALAVAYEGFLYDPRAYVIFHNTTQALAAVPVLLFVAALALFIDRAAMELSERGLRSCLAGALIGFVVPALVFGLSGMSGGVVSVTATAWLAFLFPVLSLPVLRPRPV
jgi:hypothetical protein